MISAGFVLSWLVTLVVLNGVVLTFLGNLMYPFLYLAFTGGWAVSMRSMSGDQTFEFLATHIQNDALILISPKDGG